MFVLRVNLSSPPRRLNYPALRTSNPSLSLSVHGFSNRQTNWILFEVSDSQLCTRFGGPFFRWFVLSSPWIDRFDSQNCPKSFTLPKLRRLLILANLTGPELPPDGYYQFFSNTTWSSAQTRPLPIKSTVSAPKPLCGCASWPGNRRRSAKKGLQ